MNNIVAVIVTYNRAQLLDKCIQAVKKQSYPCDILVVDNASTDGTKSLVKNYTEHSDNIFYINTGKNIGGAGGFNTGMRNAVEKGYEYVWIMDDDCLPYTDTLEKLITADKQLNGPDNYGYLSSVVLWTDGTECRMNRQKYGKKYYENTEKLTGTVPVEQSTFVSLLFPAKTIIKAGLPIKEFFIWGDDIEYTRRITVRNNMPSFMVGESKVIHAMKDNNGSSIATDGLQRIDRYRYAYRNENYLYRKEGIKGFCFYTAKCGLNFCRVIFKSKNYKLKRCCIIIGSMIKGLFFNPSVEYIESPKG